MANNDPVSGLMASMSRVRQRRPEGTALEAGTAAQAGTVLPQPKVQVAQPVKASSFREVLPAPAQAAPTPTPEMALESSVSPVDESLPASGPQVATAVAGAATALLKATADLSYGDAYLLGLGYMFGIEPDQVAERQANQLGI